ncbi:MAG: FmdE family protein [Deltaproteobacteria bacterium]|nr:FmdE family protein [Rudaea sp.]HSM95794.1 FmdE family protein [Rhizomicrobium sp.]
MALPDFYALAPRILMRDPLAEFLGAASDGLIEYGYADAVRLAGHSCPTVAGAYLMARAALRALYPDAPAERGGVTVTMSAPESEGTTGVVAQVFTLITGAAAANGFRGIGGRFARDGLLAYAGGDTHLVARFRRRDTGAEVGVALDASRVAPAPDLRERMGRALAGDATAPEREAFAEAWQDRVRRLLLEHADDPRVIRIERYA